MCADCKIFLLPSILVLFSFFCAVHICNSGIEDNNMAERRIAVAEMQWTI